MNLSDVRKIQKGCGFEHALVKVKKAKKVKGDKPVPKASSIKNVLDKIKLSPGLWRQELITLTGLSTLCIDSCLASLLASGAIVKTKVGQAGPFPMYSYSVASK